MRIVQKKKQANILGTEPQDWNSSTLADQKIQKDGSKDLKRQLLKVRAGLMDEHAMKPSKAHDEGKIEELQKFIVEMTGKGPIGPLTGKWMNPVDERGLAKHVIADHWPDWDPSHSTHSKEDKVQAAEVLAQKEERRLRMRAKAQRLLNEKLLADEKLARFPIQHESFRPNLSLTTQDRRYKEYHHPGTWGWSKVEKRHTWSCCLSFGEDSR